MGHNWVRFAYRLLVYCYLEFKLRYLKNMKLFSIRVKELFEPAQRIELWTGSLVMWHATSKVR